MRVERCMRGALGLLVVFASVSCTHKTESSPDAGTQPRKADPAVVAVRTVSEVAHDGSRAMVTILTSDSAGKPLEQGSGFVVSPDGKVVTNFHVIDGAQAALVKFADGGMYTVDQIIGADKGVDIAVLKLSSSGKEFPVLRTGDSGHVEVGEEIIVLGSPMGLEGSVSTGIISGKRPFGDMEIFQITAPISPGSSGGALLNAKGEVVGVPFIQFVNGQNLNFAIPIKYVLPIIAGTPAKSVPIPARHVVQPVKAAPPAAPQKEKPPIAVEPNRHSLSELNGTYTGVWQSTVFAAQGAAVMTVTTDHATVHAEIALTGGSVIRDTLQGDAAEVGGGWSVKFKTAAGDLYATGIFKNGIFEGDYDYVPASDHGRWGLKKD